MRFRLMLTTFMCCVVGASALLPLVASANDLGIGSKAPALNIEHWVQDGNGFFKPVTEFEKDKVYVVEFWATWCGPCIQSMPHLADLQNKYRGNGVQIVSVSDEPLDTVKDLLGKKNEDFGKTFAEVTAAYSLTTDPDRSVYKDYMTAAKQQGIPTAFIVGKTGLVEWIGHPMEMDGPLAAVVDGKWDRDAFAQEMVAEQKMQESMQRLSMLASTGKFAEAIALAEAQGKEATTDAGKQRWMEIKYSLKLSANSLDDDSLIFFRNRIKALKSDPLAMARFGYSLYGQAQQGVDIKPLLDDAVAAMEEVAKDAEPQMKPLMFNTLAMLASESGDLKKAIAAQQAAIDSTDDERQKKRLIVMLDEFKQKAADGSAGDATEK
ncbi:MAG: redoxin domain protein [Planctomycetaceae bacterium TMED240]|nr:MAG: redoxin domain protein [Planctomycetaceae bacterium TMED240]